MAGLNRWPKIDREGNPEDAALLILEWLAKHGVNAMIRVDPERLAEGKPAWTFVASGGPLKATTRVDADTANECFARALAYLREAGLVVPW
ncbi:hypothetical protein SMC26_26540 [Actinomadura fulvescens]|uniref:Uncharacterized protein n=1 Tax=Actinomadura fulvescens TaxID=46160 RepID=A0ABP6CKF5_9ACTN